MGICTRRHFLLSVCILQLISAVIRQVFDFLGYMWIPILVNFFEIIFIIFGFFGTFQYQPKYVISYSVWNLILLAWNLFLVCLYLDIGVLNHQNSTVLKLDPDSSSWWESNGPGCKVTYNTTALPKPSNVTDCIFNYTHVEVFQASVQCVLAFVGCVTGVCLGSAYLEKDDSFEFLDGDCRNPRHLALQPMYVSDTNIPLTSSLLPSSRLFVSRNSRIAFDGSIRSSVLTDNDSFPIARNVLSHSDMEHIGTNISPAYPYSHSPISKNSREHINSKSKVTFHADRIRKSNRETSVSRSKSFDRLLNNDKKFNKTNVANRTRPKSLYCNVFPD